MEQARARGSGPTRRRSTCEKDGDRVRAEMERERYVVSVIVLESENGAKGHCIRRE